MNVHFTTALETAGAALVADAVRAFGAVHLRALGGSMAPAIRPRDTLVVAGCDITDLRPRDVVLFVRNGRLVAHRLLELRAGPAGPALVTRGDALWDADTPVAASDLVGRIVAVGRRGVFRAPAGCSALSRVRGLVASECTAVRLRIRR